MPNDSIPLTAAALLLAASSLAQAEGALMTWNIEGGQASPEEIAERVEQALAAVGPVEVLVLQEVVAVEQIEAAAEAGSFAHWAMSDFSPPVEITEAWWKSLEVVMLSRIPITAASEWDISGYQPQGDGYPPRVSPEGIPSTERAISASPGRPPPWRGFLRADLANGWSVYAVHWKSSRGENCTVEDLDNARQREIQAVGLVEDARAALAEGRTVIVAGDFNIQAPGRVPRVGTDPAVDCAPADGRCEGVCGADGLDGYDDSLALLLGMDSSARLLSGALDSTYVLRHFPGGAIDHILVAGPGARGFAEARVPEVSGKRWLGSDHRGVFVDSPRPTSSQNLHRTPVQLQLIQ